MKLRQELQPCQAIALPAVWLRTKSAYTTSRQGRCYDTLKKTETLLCIRYGTDSFGTAESESI
jgi:hypothetical protein